MTQLENKQILILGGTSGFGYAVALMALQQHAQVSITGRDAKKLKQCIDTFKTQGFDVHGEIFDGYQANAAQQLASRLNEYDHIISTVGSFMGGGFLSASYETIIKAISEKFNANLAIAQAFASHIGTGGSLTFTAGSGGKPYNASGAIIGNQNIRLLVQGLAVELAPNIRVNAVSPTWTETPLWRDLPSEQVEAIKTTQAAQIPLKRTAKIEEVASAYIFLMQNSFITGQTIAVDGGIDLV
ncbi:MAG: SDR family oxidoreductase [Acinetobacter populi]|jgi:NAD(P)-dependent dehydrogenase (short-subunit alcohol dehydrogenase family)|uniref:SDR family oxidoreductase n=1 Tax=Acinetobacter populi TaxID=1582270 RepID=UPI0023579805|nr:SDR family oxidoreductase [Acinetobacter populi]MCH4246600.1 SDR family oxidoreductase [Acinetobacter populi]